MQSVASSVLHESTMATFNKALSSASIAEAIDVLYGQAATLDLGYIRDVLLLVLIAMMMLTALLYVMQLICCGASQKVQKKKADAPKQQPPPSTKSVEHDDSNNNNKKGSAAKQKNVKFDAKEESKAKEPTPADGLAMATKRTGPMAVASSTIRGFPEVDILLSSPSQNFLLVSCRQKRRTCIYAMSDDVSFLSKGKALQEAGAFVSVEDALVGAMGDSGSSRKPEVYSAQYASDDTRLIVGERVSDTFFVFASSPGTTASRLVPLWTVKLPNRRLVSSLTNWGVLDGDSIIHLMSDGCEVEVVGKDGSSQTGKFKVGTATAWAQQSSQVAVSGSFLKEARLARVVTRADRVSLDTVCIFPNPAKLRVTAMALIVKGVPAFNTRSYLVVFTEDGVGTIYDLDSLAQHNVPEVVGTFADTDYAGFSPAHPLRLTAHVAGKAYQERLLLCLVRGSDATVLRQKTTGPRCDMERLADLFGPQEGDVVKEAVFVQGGRGIATCGDADGRQVRLFTLPTA